MPTLAASQIVLQVGCSTAQTLFKDVIEGLMGIVAVAALVTSAQVHACSVSVIL